MKKDRGQITLIMVIASMAVLSIIIATTTNTMGSTRTLAVIKNSQENYEEALFVNDYICGKFQEYISKNNRSENIYKGTNYYKSKINDYFNEAINIINNKCNLNAENTQAPGTITVTSYDGVAGYYQHWFYRVYNYTKIVRYKYNIKIGNKYRNIILEMGIVETNKIGNKKYSLSYATSFIYNAGGV